MNATVKSIFEEECAKLVLDSRLVKRIDRYQHNFVNKNEDHITFFGDKLVGVKTIRFVDNDRDTWFNEILEIDEGPLGERLKALPTINPDFAISSDTMNLSCVWLMHAVYSSNNINEKQKHEALINIALVLQYKYFTSLLYHYFKYPADKEIMEAVYASLNFKFAIKQYGNWSALLNARSEEIISKTSIHYNTIRTMDDDYKVVYLLNDTQGRIRDMLKNIYRVFDHMHRNGIRIRSTSSIIEHDGVAILKDKSKSLLMYGRYIESIITDRNSFIRQELVTIIEKVQRSMSPRLFRESLEWMSDNYRQDNAQIIEKVIQDVLIHSFDYLSENRDLVQSHGDLAGLIARLRGGYMSSRSVDPVLITLRENVETIVKLATGNKNPSILASVRTGICLYIVLRAFTMRYYTSGTPA